MLSYDTLKVLRQYWQDIGSPCSIRLSDAVSNNEYGVVLKILSSLDQNKWMDPFRHRRARMSIDIIKKADYLPIDIDRVEQCIISFCDAERMCRDTNWRMTLVSMNHSSIPLSYMRLIKRIKRIVRRMLGPIPDMFYHEGKFGPGATLSNPRSQSSLYEKLGSKPTITHECAWFFPALPSRLRDVWGRDNNLTFVTANQFLTVPKSFKTERGICKEPLVNAYVQRGFGLHIRKRLQKFGIDLDVADKLHCQLAKTASIDGKLSTIDMSMASDTISREFVRMVLPHGWYRLLDSCRSKYTDLGQYYFDYHDIFSNNGIMSEHHYCEKFSSNGNGFTFELETLLFTAIARACGDPNARSFGDDLIVDTRIVSPLIDALSFCGFKVNTEKTFSTGSFRESCGGDFRMGHQVNGVTLKTEPKCIDDWYTLHNRLFIMSRDYNFDLTRTLHVIRAQVPKRLRFSIPSYLGTGGFFAENPRGVYRNSIMSYRTYRRINVQTNKCWWNDYDEQIMLASILLGGSSDGPKGSLKGCWRVMWDPPIEVTQ